MLVAPGGVGEHMALHHQRRILPVGKAEERGPGCAAVQAGSQKTADAAERSSAFRYDMF